MGQNLDHRRGLPHSRLVEDWLLQRYEPPVPGLSLRERSRLRGAPSLLSVPHRFRVGGFFRRHVLFSIEADHGLPQVRRESWGTRGLFAFDGESLLLLRSDDDSFARLMEREGRALSEADPIAFSLLMAELVLGAGHRLLDSANALKSDAWLGFTLDDSEFDRISDQLTAPTMVSSDGRSRYRSSGPGQLLRFATAARGRNWDVGLETIHITGEFALERRERQVLSDRIFSRVPTPTR